MTAAGVSRSALIRHTTSPITKTTSVPILPSTAWKPTASAPESAPPDSRATPDAQSVLSSPEESGAPVMPLMWTMVPSITGSSSAPMRCETTGRPRWSSKIHAASSSDGAARYQPQPVSPRLSR